MSKATFDINDNNNKKTLYTLSTQAEFKKFFDQITPEEKESVFNYIVEEFNNNINGFDGLDIKFTPEKKEEYLNNLNKHTTELAEKITLLKEDALKFTKILSSFFKKIEDLEAVIDSDQSSFNHDKLKEFKLVIVSLIQPKNKNEEKLILEKLKIPEEEAAKLVKIYRDRAQEITKLFLKDAHNIIIDQKENNFGEITPENFKALLSENKFVKFMTLLRNNSIDCPANKMEKKFENCGFNSIIEAIFNKEAGIEAIHNINTHSKACNSKLHPVINALKASNLIGPLKAGELKYDLTPHHPDIEMLKLVSKRLGSIYKSLNDKDRATLTKKLQENIQVSSFEIKDASDRELASKLKQSIINSVTINSSNIEEEKEIEPKEKKDKKVQFAVADKDKKVNEPTINLSSITTAKSGYIPSK